MMHPVLRLMRFHQPIGILLLLWPALIALWVASAGVPNWKWFTIFVLGVITMRAAGCVINDMTDAKFDKDVARTRLRPLATGELTQKKCPSGACCIAVDGFGFVAVFAPIHLGIWGGGICHHSDLSMDETFYPCAPIGIGHCLCLFHSHGICVYTKSIAPSSLGLILGHCTLDGCLRHHVRESRQTR